MPKDYYQILGVPRDASKEQIKDAYRKLALEWHPDRNKSAGAEDRFKQISEAYAVLSDGQKRSQFDQFGSDDFSRRYSQQDIFRGADFSQIFQNMGFGGPLFGDDFENLFGQMMSGGRGRARAHGEDLQMQLEVTLEEAAMGIDREIAIPRRMKCSSCNGTGSKDGKKATCSACKGVGQVKSARQMGYSSFITIMPCRQCGGEGSVIATPCAECKGSGAIKKEDAFKVKIPKGIYDGFALRIRGKGNSRAGHEGDLYIMISIAKHEFFERDIADIHMEAKIPFSIAAIGGEMEVPTLWGDVKLKIPPGTQAGKIFRLHGKGMFDLRVGGIGDEYVKIAIHVPQKLTKKQHELLEEFTREEERGGKGFFGKFFH
ncbi:MAG: molecular chaperone DnaJ [Candidatus Micrarchaeota archaeon]